MNEYGALMEMILTWESRSTQKYPCAKWPFAHQKSHTGCPCTQHGVLANVLNCSEVYVWYFCAKSSFNKSRTKPSLWKSKIQICRSTARTAKSSLVVWRGHVINVRPRVLWLTEWRKICIADTRTFPDYTSVLHTVIMCRTSMKWQWMQVQKYVGIIFLREKTNLDRYFTQGLRKCTMERGSIDWHNSRIYCLITSKEQSPWIAQVRQQQIWKFSRFCAKLKVHYWVHNSAPLDPNLIHFNRLKPHGNYTHLLNIWKLSNFLTEN